MNIEGSSNMQVNLGLQCNFNFNFTLTDVCEGEQANNCEVHKKNGVPEK